ncbi:MAG TPA: hypothetical protein VG734_20535 [Lacunisphaera sp.]|nr:hypothetical protein [Lacunisphaera sp.]
MNNAEAKFILQGYRPNGTDADDATFTAALEQAKNDPGVAEWFARQRAFDAAISAKLAQIEPPADLRAAILAGGRVSGEARQRSWWNRPAWMAAAAGIAVMLGAGVVLWPKTAGAFMEFAVADAKMSAIHGGHGHENNTLQEILNSPDTKLGQKLPINFANLHETGCRTISFRGHDILELCFKRNGVWFHAYFARKTDFPNVAKNTTPVLQDRGSIAIASWTDEEHVIVVVSKTGRRNLEALL